MSCRISRVKMKGGGDFRIIRPVKSFPAVHRLQESIEYARDIETCGFAMIMCGKDGWTYNSYFQPNHYIELLGAVEDLKQRIIREEESE